MSGVFGGDGGSLTHVQLGGGSPSGLPSLPGMNEEFGGQPRFFPSQGAALAQGNSDLAGANYGTPDWQLDPATGQPRAQDNPLIAKLGKISKPSFPDAIRQGGENAANSALSKGGKFIAFLSHIAESTAAGASGGDFGEGFLAASNLHRRKQLDEQSATTQKIQLARQQQNDELNKSNINSEIALRSAQMEKAQQEPAAAQPSLVQDGQGSVVGWKDAAGFHGMDDPNTPAGIKAIAGAYKQKGPAFSAAEVALAKELKKKPEDLTLAEINQADRAHQQAIHIDTGGGDAKGAVTVAVPQPDGSSKLMRVAPGESIPAGAKPVAKFGAEDKASADEQRRADLANNANENINAFEDIVKRRPELFGPIAGRMTEIKMATGSSDPDIAALKAIHEYFGMASVGAHAMRNAQHVKDAANAVMDFHQDPNAMLDPERGSITRARKSLQTFINDAQPKTKGAAAPKATNNDPLGIR